MHGALQLPDHMTTLLRAGQLQVTVVPSDLNFDGNMNLLDVCTDTISSATYRNTLQYTATHCNTLQNSAALGNTNESASCLHRYYFGRPILFRANPRISHTTMR